ncbi:nonribosomal peptide synthase [Aspergillus pseudoviridinutans]|uniref:Nonribosomal peptide synthase n=1 Tax=Aspergillus pseudoviridinutans TaxID=1517512 RepID=A0A9P3BM53_9EURO|nr:nonribosomal peptide synthase [Aspergillus pseudoviridinutans]GIJ91845.1 nonribosomal peptide synthase [Aspergillus pseudoviridinutans]
MGEYSTGLRTKTLYITEDSPQGNQCKANGAGDEAGFHTSINTLSAKDILQLQSWNGKLPTEEDSCIHELIKDQCSAQPDAAAVCAWDGNFTYREVDLLSSRLADQLISCGVGPNLIVAVLLHKSKWTPAVVLAVLKAGGAFLLLDPACPDLRLRQICEESGARWILCRNSHAAKASDLGPEVITVDAVQSHLAINAVDIKGRQRTSSRSLAYVIFTSGSTGKPKGVKICHRSFCSMVRPYVEAVGYNRETRALSFSSYAFDVSVSDMLIPLLVGGCICVPSEAQLMDNLPTAIARLQANFADMTPTLLRTLRPEQVPSIETIVVGGEALSKDIIAIWSPHVRLVNSYGPAECSINAALNNRLTPQTDPSNVGFPVGARIWIVDPDDHEKLMPASTVGELLIEGPTVGSGYINSPEQMAASFIEPPTWMYHFRPSSPYNWGLYKTGDLARRETDGSIRILGRKDNQVKLRGQRMELSEVEHHVRECIPTLDDVAAEVVVPPGDRRTPVLMVFLWGMKEKSPGNHLFAVPSDATRAEIATVQSELKKRLPIYMVPGVFLVLSTLPLTATGKLDRRRLRTDAAALSSMQLLEYNATATPQTRMPTTPSECALQQIWARVLNLQPQVISADADFFGLGGDSIAAMQASAQARTAGLNCRVADIFHCRTISKLAGSLEMVPQSPMTIEREQLDTPFHLSPIQQMFFEEVPPQQHNYYNQSFLLRCNPPTTSDELRGAVTELLTYHCMLRTRYSHVAPGRWMQSIPAGVDGSYRFDAKQVRSDDEARAIMMKSQQSLDIQRGPLVSVDLLDMQGGLEPEQYIFIVAHHLVVDWVSWRIILEDLEGLLSTGRLLDSAPSLPFQVWCRLQSEHAQAHLLPDAALPFELPPSQDAYWDLAPHRNTWADSHQERFTLDLDATKSLLGPANNAFGTQPVEILHAALLYSFAQVFRDRPVPALFSEGHGREPWDPAMDLSRTVGWFTTIWPTYIDINHNYTLGDVLRRVKDCRRLVPNKGRAYFASRYLNNEGRKKFANHGRMEISFNYIGLFQQLERPGARLQSATRLSRDGVEDISGDLERPELFDITAVVSQGCLEFRFVYSRHIPRQQAITQWIGTCEQSLKAAAQELVFQPHSYTLRDFPLLPLTYPSLDRLLYDTLPAIGLSSAMVQAAYPCSPVQRGILVAQSWDPDRYHCQLICRVISCTGAVELDRIAQAWRQVVDRHEILRTVFIDAVTKEGYLDQVVLKTVDVDLDVLEWDESAVSMVKRLQSRRPFPGGSKPLHRLTLCATPTNEVLCKLEINHALIDEISAQIVLRDLSRAYDGRLSEPSNFRFVDYIGMLHQQESEAARCYWTSYLKGVEPCLFPPLNKTGENDASGAWRSFDLDIPVDSNWRTYCSTYGVTPANIFQAAWGLVLRCYTGFDEVCFGYTTSGRDMPLPGIDHAVGPFINMLVSRLALRADTSLLEVLQGSQTDYTRALAHQHYALADIFHSMNLSGKTLFNTGISLNRLVVGSEEEESWSPTISFETISSEDNTEYDVIVEIALRSDIARATFTYRPHVLSETQKWEMADTFREAVSEILACTPDTSIRELPLFGSSNLGHVSANIGGSHRVENYCRRQLANYSGEAFPTIPRNYCPEASDSFELSVAMEGQPGLSDSEIPPLMQLAWAIVLSQYTGSEDILFGILEGEQAGGVLPVRIRVDSCDHIADKLQEAQEDRQTRLSLQQCRVSNALPLYDTPGAACQYHNILLLEPRGASSIRELDLQSTLGHPLVVVCQPLPDNTLIVRVNFDKNCLESAKAQRIGFQVAHILRQVHANPTRQVGEILTLSPEDMERLDRWNEVVPERIEACVHECIHAHAVDHPDAPAICAWDGDFSYQQLDEYSSQLAWQLKRMYVRPGVVVPVCQEKTRWTAVAILGVLKAGGAFALLDPEVPTERLMTIAGDLNSPVAISTPHTAPICHQLAAEVVVLGDPEFPLSASATPSTMPPSTANPADDLYVVFTSGSTGKPKGVVIHHSAFYTGALAQNPSRFLDRSSRTLQFASYMFDVSIADFLRTLLAGGCVCIPAQTGLKDTLAETIGRLRVNRLDLTPSVLRLLSPEAIPSVRTITLGGEPMTSKDVECWAGKVQLMNCYGPAECSYCVTQSQVLHPHRSDAGNIGRGQGAICWVVDRHDHRRLVPIGAVGELVVEGPIVGRGYLHDHQKSAQAFIADPPPWLRRLGRTGLLYKTGDLVQYTRDGSLLYIGRKDNQAKLHGQRLEMGEVEYHVRRCFPSSRDVVAELITPLVSNGEAEPLLAAFIETGQCDSRKDQPDQPDQIFCTATSEFLAGGQQAREQLEQQVPGYMVPTIFIPLYRVPLTHNGKKDRRLLRQRASQIPRKDLFAAYAQRGGVIKRPPSTRTERLLLSVLSQVLEIEPHDIGMDDNFFSLGGDSIVAIRFAQLARQHRLFFRVADVFRNPRVSDLVLSLSGTDESAARDPTPAAASTERYFGFKSWEELRKAFLSSSLSCLGPQLPHDDVQDILPATEGQDSSLRLPCTYFILNLRGPMDNTKLKMACQALIQRHTILRTIFLPYQSKTAQVVLHERAIDFWRSVHCEDIDLDRATNDLINKDCIPIPSMSVLITQFTLVQGRDDDHRSLVVRLSHAQYDAFSISTLLSDLKALFEGVCLPQAPSFAAYLEECMISKSDRAADFWTKLLRDSHMTRLGNRGCGTETLDFNTLVEDERTIPLPCPLLRGETTLANLIKAAWSLVLSRLGNCRDVVFVQTTNGRHLASEETQGVVGLCIRRLPVRVALDPTWTVLDLLRVIQNQHSDALSFESVELQELMELGSLWGPGVQCGSILVHQNVNPENTFKIGQANCSVQSVAKPYPTNHILIETIPSNSHLRVRLVTSSQILDKSGAEMVLQRLCDTIMLFASSPSVPLAEIQMSPAH